MDLFPQTSSLCAMNGTRFLLLSLAVTGFVVIGSACSSDDRVGRDGGPGGTDTSGGPCTDGEIQCSGFDVQVCSGGTFSTTETCEAPSQCVAGVGCGACTPRALFCDGQEIRECAADGTSSTLVQECPPNEGCQNGLCVDACAAAAANRSNIGCDYFAVDLDNEYSVPAIFGGSTPPAQEQFAVVLANPSNVTVQANVYQSVGRPNVAAQTQVGPAHIIPPNGVVRINLDPRELDGSTPSVEGPGTFLSNHAYRIQTNFPVVAYQFNPIIESASNDASLLLPVPALDSHYRVLGWPTANPIEPIGNMPGIPDHSYVTIVGTQEGTQVSVTLGGDTVAGGIQGGGSIQAYSAGETITMTIGPYDVLNLESDGIPGDLSGTLVQSTAPVAVFSGGERGIVGGGSIPAHPSGAPDDFCCTEHLEEQVFPTTSWGKNFVITRSPVRTDHPTWREPDVYRILSDRDGTVVTTSLAAPNNQFTLAAGQWVEFYADQSFTMESNEGISIQQLLVSQGWLVSWKPDHGGDPSMILFPPLEQYRDNYIVLTPETFATNYVVVSAPEGANFTVDGAAPSCATEPAGSVGGTTFTTHTCLVGGGVHSINSDVPVGVMVYGYHNVGSYGYAGGSNLTRINPLI